MIILPRQARGKHKEELRKEMRCSQAMELRRPPPPGTTLEDVPGTGACLFHAIAMTQDVDEARVLRQAVVNYVVSNWEVRCVSHQSVKIGPFHREFTPIFDLFLPINGKRIVGSCGENAL